MSLPVRPTADEVNPERGMMPIPPQSQPQRIVAFLTQLLGIFVKLSHLGEFLSPPLAIYPTPYAPHHQPDLLFVAGQCLKRHRKISTETPVDLVIDVIGDDSRAHTCAEAFDAYQAAGITEYWLLDLRYGSRRVELYTLDAKGHYQPVHADREGCYHSTVLPGFWFKVDWVCNDEPPDVLQALAQIVGPRKFLEIQDSEADKL